LMLKVAIFTRTGPASLRRRDLPDVPAYKMSD
jgi:hypothetical protein